MNNTKRRYHIIKPLLMWAVMACAVSLQAQSTYNAKPLYQTSSNSMWSKYHSQGGGISPIGATGISSYGGTSSSSFGGTSFGTRSNVSLSFNYDRQYSVGATSPSSVGKRMLDGENQGDNPSQPYWPPVGEIPFVLMALLAAGFALLRRRKVKA